MKKSNKILSLDLELFSEMQIENGFLFKGGGTTYHDGKGTLLGYDHSVWSSKPVPGGTHTYCKTIFDSGPQRGTSDSDDFGGHCP